MLYTKYTTKTLSRPWTFGTREKKNEVKVEEIYTNRSHLLYLFLNTDNDWLDRIFTGITFQFVIPWYKKLNFIASTLGKGGCK